MNPRRKERKESLGPYDREQPQQRYAFPTQSSQPYPNTNASMTGSSPHSANFPRATSPSGFTGLFTKPAKWFSRSREPHISTSSNNTEPRSSTSSVQPQRRPLISQPTDPRPLLPSLQSEPYMQSPRVGSRSVLDLSLARTHTAIDQHHPYPSPSSGSPNRVKGSAGLGDLRSISLKPWSRSADELGTFGSVSAPTSPASPEFQDRVDRYRGTPVSPPRKNSVPNISLTSTPLSTSPPSSSPGSLSPLANASSQHSPTSLPTGAPQVHARSHSFTPKLPSKLAPVKGSSPIPMRKQLSGSSEKEGDAKERERNPMFAGRGAFPFTFGTGGGRSPGESTLLPPPTIVEPGDSSEMNEKRSSQITYQSGFVNRFPDFSPPAPHLSTYAFAPQSLAKGWKPFKLVLRGTKLHFYKPPSDRTAAVKELFPTEIIMVEEEAEGTEDVSATASLLETEKKSDSGRSVSGSGSGRRKRAFWGRRRHPDLVVNAENEVQKGSLEALVHEAVFGTLFRPQEGSTIGERRADWQAFASMILFGMPELVGSVKFELELIRCCTFFINGSDEATREEERENVIWLAGEYLRFHGNPAEPSAWEDFRKDTIPTFSMAQSQSESPTLTASSSTFAMFARSPAVGTQDSSSHNALSPNVNTFSPRPSDAVNTVSLTEALITTQPYRPALISSPTQSSLDYRPRPSTSTNLTTLTNKELVWNVLEREGFTKDVLIRLHPALISNSLLIFNRSLLSLLPDNLTAEFVFSSDGSSTSKSPAVDASGPHGEPKASPPPPPFFGSDDRPHWLTKLVLLHILGPDTSASFSTRSPEEYVPQTSRTHTRAEVISAWTRVAELSRSVGDECSWRAIRAALCSRPVARLDKAWRRVDPAALNLVEHWVVQGEGQSTVDTRAIPWGGDTRERIRTALERAKIGEEGSAEWAVSGLKEARDVFEGFRTNFSPCPRKVEPSAEEKGEEISTLIRGWQELYSTGGGIGSIASQFQHVDQFMSLSLAAESRHKGLYETQFWTRASSSTGPTLQYLAPLLFPEPLPAISFINRGDVLRIRADGGPIQAQLNVQELQFLRKASGNPRLSLSSTRGKESFSFPELGGTVIPLFNGELFCLVQPGGSERSLSRPSSRAHSRPPGSRPPSGIIENGIPSEKPIGRVPSIRVKSGASSGLDRKASLARRNSLPTLSQRSSVVIPEHPPDSVVRVVIQAGTMDRLVEVLAHGLPGVTVSIADDNGEMPLREGKQREIRMDKAEFSLVWWKVFRSFITPANFFEALQKRFTKARSNSFDLAQAATVREEILDVIGDWLQNGGGAQDILDNTTLYHAVESFLTGATDLIKPRTPLKDDANATQAYTSLQETLAALTALFLSQTMRPSVRPLFSQETSPTTTESQNFGPDAPDLDAIQPEALVNNLDAMAAAAFRNITEEDLFIAADLLEVQAADRLGWLTGREGSTTSDDVDLQTIYSHLTEIEPSSLIAEITQESLFRLLPPGIRSCLRAHHVLRKWVISKLVAPRLGLQARQFRMELILQAIEICRNRSTSSSSALPLSERPCVRSFVEGVLTSAIVSVESRAHQRAWLNVANNRRVTFDSVASLLSNPVCLPSPVKRPLTTDIGWTLERLLEMISLPDTLQPPVPEGELLVSFEKRRHICYLITSFPSFYTTLRNPGRRDVDLRDFERLSNIEKEVHAVHLDLRAIKDDAYREAIQIQTNKRVQRPFQKLISLQHEKNKRDRTLRDRFTKERKMEQLRNDRRDDYFSKAIPSRRPSAGTKQHRPKKSSGTFFQQLMRPISSAFSLDNVDTDPGEKRTAAELDFAPSGKPALVLSVAEAKVTQYMNYERSFTFQLDTEDGGNYLLQTATRAEMLKWIQTIDRISKTAAKRRLTYLGNSPKPQLSDHIQDRSNAGARDPNAVFGVDLEFLLKREAPDGVVIPGALPSMIENCLTIVERRGLSEVGIYRIAGANSEVKELKDALNRGEWPITESTDIYAVCDLIKSWFRVLPEPVFPPYSYHDVIEAMKIEDFNARLERIRTAVQALPTHNFYLLKRVVEHLDKVTDYEEHNQMTSDALAIVFSPNLLRAPHNDFVMIMANMPYTNKLVKALVTHFHTIFDEADPEAEVDQEEDEEDDFDDPIPEEEEEPETEFMPSPSASYPDTQNSVTPPNA